MMRWGRIPCDGEMLGRRCSACTLQGLGLNRFVATTLASMPKRGRERLAKRNRSGGMWTALRMRELVEQRHRATRGLLAEVDHIVAVCEWVQDVLLRNGVPSNKITLCRQGIGLGDERWEMGDSARAAMPERFSKQRPLRLVYFGRLDPTKGVHVLIEALRLDRSLPVSLDIYGTAQGEGGGTYAARVKKLAGDDPRIRFCSPVPADQVVRTLREYDMLAVPSQWLETGPLVVLEAFAAGIPVLGSNLGGIAELVHEGIDGFLVNATGANEWYYTLKRMCSGFGALAKLYRSISGPPTMSAVAQTMIRLYQRLLEPLHASP